MRTAVFATALLVLFACQPGPEDQTKNTPPQTGTMSPAEGVSTLTSTMNPPAQVQRDNPGGNIPVAPPIQEVHLIEYQIHMPDSIPAGRIAFHIENGGKEDHGFDIEGNGVHQRSAVLKRGDTTSLELNLAPGTYTIYCPVDAHKDKGMTKTLVVK